MNPSYDMVLVVQLAGEVKCHKYSRRRPSEGWNFTVEKMGPRGKRGGGGGWKFVSLPDGSSRPLNEMEKMYVKRETPRRRRKILPWWPCLCFWINLKIKDFCSFCVFDWGVSSVALVLRIFRKQLCFEQRCPVSNTSSLPLSESKLEEILGEN